MSNDGRCTCGCRIFYDRSLRMTTADGSAYNIPGIQIVECVNCANVSKVVGTDGERKTVIPFVSGRAAEKDLFLAAMDAWKVDHDKAPNSHYFIHEEADMKDFERLGIPQPEQKRRLEVAK